MKLIVGGDVEPSTNGSVDVNPLKGQRGFVPHPIPWYVIGIIKYTVRGRRNHFVFPLLALRLFYNPNDIPKVPFSCDISVKFTPEGGKNG